jgi:hypothetical protein
MALRKFVLLVYTLTHFQVSSGQSYLVLETKGKVKGKKYPIGSVIKVHLTGEPRNSWELYTIKGFDFNKECIQVSESYCLPLTAVDRFDIRPSKNNRLAKKPPKFYVHWSYFQYFNGEKKLNQRHRLKIVDNTLPVPGG